MKRYTIFILLMAGIAIFTSCRKSAIDSPDDFKVATARQEYKIGDTVQFDFTGTANMLVFYSGEAGARYENRERVMQAGLQKLVFQSSMQQGVLPNGDEMRLMIATDLKGYDPVSIQAANWTDITARNTKWPVALSTAFITSDSINISDFNTAEKVNIAFRFLGKKNPASAQRKWQIQNLTLSNNLPDGTITSLFSNFANTGWVQASIKNDNFPGTYANGYIGYNAWNVGTGNISTADSVRNSNGIPIRTAYPITFDPGTSLDNDENDDWLITSAVDLNTTKPDGGTVIKNGVALSLPYYRYIVKKNGTFNMTFVAINSSGDGEKTVVRQVSINVRP